jgi:ABC-2 type transport system permease protein
MVLAWTPFGAPWALAIDAALGQWGLMFGHLAVTVLYLVSGLWLYARVLDKALVTPARGGSSTLSKHDSIARAGNWIWAQGTLVPVAAITSRCLRYWRRDPRYLGQIPAVFLILILFTVMGITLPMLPSDGDGEAFVSIISTGMIGFGLGFTALMAGYVLVADVASDASAWWIHLTSGIKGWQDRLGRTIALCVWAVPVLLLAGILVPVIFSGTERIPAVLGAMFALYLTGAAASAVFSALIIYPVALPGESPLKMKTGMMGSQMLSQFGCMTVGGLLGLPIAIWAIFATGWVAWLVLVIGLVWGGGVLGAGIFLGGRILDSRGPAILQILKKNDTRERS